MFLLHILLALVGMVLLVAVLIYFASDILQTKKNGYSLFILVIIVFFLVLILLQGINFIK